MKRWLPLLQGLAFVAITAVAVTVGYYFPNLPPFVRAILPGGSKGVLRLQRSAKPDPRFLAWFNRDPERRIPTEPRVLVSPADGVVETIRDFKGMHHIVIEMRYTDVHVQRVPMDGVVVSVEGEGRPLAPGVRIGDYVLGKFWPYQKITTFKTEIGLVRVHQITSFFAKRVEVWVKVGQRVRRGQRLGRVLAGSTIVLEVPKAVRICVRENQEVVAGETIVGRY